MTEAKIYRVTGEMLVSPDHFPEKRIFRLEIVARNEKEALEKIYSELGSRHKIKRSHIKILELREISKEEVLSSYVKKLLAMGARQVE